jgi:peptidoglycan-N-acetylglucosamine deacetylase
VLWNAVPGDWADAGWVERALEQIAAQDWTLLVLHDVAGACAERLDEFLASVEATFRQAFPPECVPIENGQIRISLEGLV